MAARFVMLAFAVLSLAACETATTDDLSVRRGASPTRGTFGHQPREVVRGPVVADRATTPRATHAAVARRRATAGRTTYADATQATPTVAARPNRVVTQAPAIRTPEVVPNPMRAEPSGATAETAPPADVPAAMSIQTDLVHQASVSEQPVAPPTPVDPQTTTLGAYPAGDPAALPIDEPVQPTPPIEFGLGELTPDKIEAMFGGMPFLLIASIAAALIASLGLALRSRPAKREEYSEPHVDHDEDYREPYAA
jgi:hypothetical protein